MEISLEDIFKLCLISNSTATFLRNPTTGQNDTYNTILNLPITFDMSITLVWLSNWISDVPDGERRQPPLEQRHRIHME